MLRSRPRSAQSPRSPLALPCVLSLLYLLTILAGAPPAFAQNDWEAGLFAQARQLPLVSQSVAVRVTGGEAEIELVQVFANDGAAAAQADYRLHLPEGATVTGFGFWREGRFLAAELKEKEQARRAHAEAAASGRATGLLEREGSIHSFSVYPIPAQDFQQVETTLRLPVATERGRSHLRLPLDTFLGHARITSTVMFHVHTEEPLRAVGVDGADPDTLLRQAHAASLAFPCSHPVDLWWAEEAPPLLTRAEAVPLEGDPGADLEDAFGLQMRVVLHDAALEEVGEWTTPFDRFVLLVDTSFSQRRRSGALADLIDRLLDQAKVPVAVYSVAETSVELDTGDRTELLRRLFSGEAGFHTRWEDLVLTADAAGCSDPRVRCLTVTDPQVNGLPAERTAPFETLFLADADELSYFDTTLGDGALTFQPDVEAPARLASLADEQMLPVLEILDIEQPGGTLKIHGTPRMRVPEGGMLRLFASSDSDQPLDLHLALAGQRFVRRVEPEILAADSPPGRAVRRGLFDALLGSWMSDYRRAPDSELRQRIVRVSLQEKIPTALTSLHVAEPMSPRILPRGATPATMLQMLGALLLLLAILLQIRTRRWLQPRVPRLRPAPPRTVR